MIRLFVAIDIPRQIRSQLHAMGRSLPGVRPVAEEQIHLTLRFIGEVEGSIFKDIREELAAVASPALTMGVKGIGHFPPRGRPRVLWAGVQPADPLIRLKRRIDTALIKCGIAPDSRKFAPHITIARISSCPLKRITSFLAGNAFLSFDSFSVDSFHLYSSKLSSKGAAHTLEASYPLPSD